MEVSKKELLFILNKELSRYEECNNCHFDAILALPEAGEDGCNWIGAHVKLRCNGEPDERCRPFVSKVMSEVGNQYNIKK
jgi:hypothetical protein